MVEVTGVVWQGMMGLPPKAATVVRTQARLAQVVSAALAQVQQA